MSDLPISEELLVCYKEVMDGEVFVIQLVDMDCDEVIKEILMTRDVAIRMAKDILKDML